MASDANLARAHVKVRMAVEGMMREDDLRPYSHFAIVVADRQRVSLCPFKLQRGHARVNDTSLATEDERRAS